jgi:hypothetical protein
MKENFILKIQHVEKMDYNGLTDIIIAIHWTYFYFLETEDRSAVRSLGGVYNLSLPDADNFTPLVDVTVEQLSNWMRFSTSPFNQRLNFEAMQERLRFMMSGEIRPTITSMIEGLGKLNVV